MRRSPGVVNPRVLYDRVGMSQPIAATRSRRNGRKGIDGEQERAKQDKTCQHKSIHRASFPIHSIPRRLQAEHVGDEVLFFLARQP